MQRFNVTVLLLLCLGQAAFSQVAINGIGCVSPGLPYQYVINGDKDSTHNVQVCLSGGAFTGSTGSCQNGSRSFTITVTWDSNATHGMITATAAPGNASRDISIAASLQGGTINNLSKSQTIPYNGTPAAIGCSVALGGNCSPGYAYRWQQSFDQVNWTPVNGANTPDLPFSAALIQTTFYRRQAVESGSGSIGYSDAAVVFVIPVSAKLH
jgi:hypothetical protein